MSDARQVGGVQEAAVGRPVLTATKNGELVRDRRKQLVEAAIKVFEEKGFHNATVRDIGRVSGLTQGTIYNYVRSKEDILYLVCDRIVTEYLDSVQRAMAAEGDLISRTRAALDGVVRVMVEHKSGILMLYHESHNLDRESRHSIIARVDQFITSFEQLLTEMNAFRPLPTKNIRSLANIITFLPTIFALRGWGFSAGVPEDELVSELVDFMVLGLGLPST